MRMPDVTGPITGLSGHAGSSGRFTPSVERSLKDRERRHRERAIAAWLRDLGR